MTRVTINYPLIAARSHYMINYMVIICLLIIVPSYILTVTKKVRADNSTDKITYVFRQDYIFFQTRLHILPEKITYGFGENCTSRLTISTMCAQVTDSAEPTLR